MNPVKTLKGSFLALVVLILAGPGCQSDRNDLSPMPTKSVNNMPASGLEKIAGIKIFFGHQSVGYNIMDGLAVLAKENSVDVRILESRTQSDFGKPVFAHGKIGKNQDPKSKIDDFCNLLSSGLADSVDVAFFKFCYVDFNHKSDQKEIFDYYTSSMQVLKEKYPGLKILHCTVPLAIKPAGLKGFARKILRLDDNRYRNDFNELMRDHYSEAELYDLARLESSHPDGRINSYFFGNSAMVPEYTSDGGHLNETGSRMAADGLIRALVRLQDMNQL